MLAPIGLHDAVAAARGQRAAGAARVVRAVIDPVIAGFGMGSVAVDDAVAARRTRICTWSCSHRTAVSLLAVPLSHSSP